MVRSRVRPLSRLFIPLLTALLAAAACSLPLTEQSEAEADESTTTTTTKPPTTNRTLPPPPTLPPLDPEVAEVLVALPGRLAFGVGGSVGVMNPDGSNAALVGGGTDGSATQPTWSTEGGLLAWSLVAIGESSIVVYDTASQTEIATELAGPPAFYLQWNSTDQLVSYLRNDSDGEGLEAGVVRPGGTPQVFDTGAPHFFEWSPDRDLWVSHVGDRRVSIVAADQVVDIDQSSRSFSTPRWLDGDRVLYAGEAGFTIVDIATGEGTTIPVPEGELPFTTTSDGTRVAYLEPQPDIDGNPRPGILRVLDLETGSIVTVTDDRVFAWEWSPDGKRLAWMGLDAADAANLAQWHFWGVDEALELDATPPFRPSDTVLGNYLPFFAQYAVSHSSWSPDGAGFAFAGSIAGDSGIWVHAIDSGFDSTRISTGDVVVWSPDEAPVGGGAPAPF